MGSKYESVCVCEGVREGLCGWVNVCMHVSVSVVEEVGGHGAGVGRGERGSL